jgi:hypothetical protein
MGRGSGEGIVIALGFDPGPTYSGIARVVYEGGQFRITYGAHLDNSTDAWRHWVSVTQREGGIVALESIHGYAYEAKRVQALNETTRQEGRIEERAKVIGVQLIPLPAGKVRGVLCRAPNASDEQIRVVIEGITAARPHVLAEQRAHIWDAAGAAIVAIVERLKLPLRLPGAVELALLQQKEADKVKRSAKREAKANGTFVPEKRSLTRAQTQRRSAASKQAWAIRKGGV